MFFNISYDTTAFNIKILFHHNIIIVELQSLQKKTTKLLKKKEECSFQETGFLLDCMIEHLYNYSDHD